MHTLSMTTGYAIQALSVLARFPEKYLLVRDIAVITGIPAPYLSKVTQRLVDVGLLDSKRGYSGGIRLTALPKDISILQIDEAVDMGGSKARCLLGNVECSDERACPLHSYWKKTREEIKVNLAGLTLAELATFENSRNPIQLPAPAPRKRSKRRSTSATLSPKIKTKTKSSKKVSPKVVAKKKTKKKSS